MTLREKTESASVVVHGVVEHVSARWTLDGARIETRVVLEVLECLRGGCEKGERIGFRRPGGEVEGVWQRAPGLAEYAAGDEVILFLEPYGETLVSIGIGIGTYRVELKDLGAGLEPVVVHAPKVAGLRFADGERPMVTPLPASEPEALSGFLKRVRSFVAGHDDRPVVLPRKIPVKLPVYRVLEPQSGAQP